MSCEWSGSSSPTFVPEETGRYLRTVYRDRQNRVSGRPDSRSFSGLERVAVPTGAGAGAQPALGTDPCSRWVPSLPSRDLVGSSLSPGVRDTTGNAMSQGVILPAVETASSGSHARRAAARMPAARQHFGSCTLGWPQAPCFAALGSQTACSPKERSRTRRLDGRAACLPGRISGPGTPQLETILIAPVTGA